MVVIPKIADLQFLPENQLRVVFEEELTDQIVPLSFLVMFGLRVGKKVSPQVLEQLAVASTVMQTKKEGKSICQNSEKPLTKSLLIEILNQKGHSPESVKTAVADLERGGYVKGVVFAQKWVDKRQKSDPRGKYLLQRELQAKGVDVLTVKHVLSQIDDNKEIELAWQICQKKAKRYRSLEPHVAKRRLQGLLLRRGFSYGTIQSVQARFETEAF
jgi:regulatory protein